MTEWLVGWDATALDMPAWEARRQADVITYRAAVADVLTALAGQGASLSPVTAERVLELRLSEPEFAAILAAVPSGSDAAVARVLREIRTFRQSDQSPAPDLMAMLRSALLSEIDLLWWGHLREYQQDDDVLAAPELLDLDGLRRGEMLLFRYRRQPSSLLGRAARSAERHATPERSPRTAGLRFACARAELIVLLNEIAADFARMAPPGTPPLWVTSLARSVAHQRHLRSLGYSAPLPSAHCVGYAADVEMAWFRRFGAEQTLQCLLLERQHAGEINVIDEGQVWHLCLRPGAGRALRLVPSHASAG